MDKLAKAPPVEPSGIKSKQLVNFHFEVRELSKKQKLRERMFVEQASKLLDENWRLHSTERPDFIISTQVEEFGLEVTECHAGKYSKKKGSQAVREEVTRDRELQNIKQKCISIYPHIKNWRFQYVSNTGTIPEDEIIQSIKTINQDNSENSETIDIIGILKKSGLPNKLGTLFISKGYGDEWIYVNDMCGWVHPSADNFQKCIDTKAKKISDYKGKIEDIRLLVVADALMNSGKASLPHDFFPNIHGFHKVYYLYNPMWITEFPSGITKSVDSRFPTRVY
ncbi:hypothetical protein GOB86_10050 [Acetobacter lambici]|uniref:Uncharacterized protein n=1 Tax=Acetobacter lambici TaxID=1332824 RepID=A0ABT1F1M3_9PROT|nr:hypothetical protein [Acetobacter lambici]MCP1242741.1 hypothetical protein [Acetobacter lambici]MCP1258886.1 hypothetical protein [Acetobacter lambici]NHO57394.1 hypothetical protein [Acetobacter lambici]